MFENYKGTMINVDEEREGNKIMYRAMAQGEGIREDYLDETPEEARIGVKHKVDRTIERIKYNNKNK